MHAGETRLAQELDDGDLGSAVPRDKKRPCSHAPGLP